MLLFWLAILVSYFYLHEFGGHYLANLLRGIHPEQMTILFFRLFGFIPVPIGVTLLSGSPSTFSHFFGGFMAGLILLVISIVFWSLYKKNRQGYRLDFFFITLSFSFVGFIECIFETFFLELHRGSLEISILAIFAILVPIGRILYSVSKNHEKEEAKEEEHKIQ